MLAAMPRTDAVVLRTSPLTAAMIDAAPGLKVVSRHGVGYDNVDLAALNRARHPAGGRRQLQPGRRGRARLRDAAGVVKHGRAFDAAVRAGDWASRNRLVPTELAGKTLLLLGFGRIGREVARRALAFDMRVLVHDPLLPPEVAVEAGCEPAPDLDGRLGAGGRGEPAPAARAGDARHRRPRAAPRMRPHAVLVNTARGGLVDEAALAEALREGSIGRRRHRRVRGGAASARPPAARPRELPALAAHRRDDRRGDGPDGRGVGRNALAALEGRLDPAAVVNPQVLAR